MWQRIVLNTIEYLERWNCELWIVKITSSQSQRITVYSRCDVFWNLVWTTNSSNPFEHLHPATARFCDVTPNGLQSHFQATDKFDTTLMLGVTVQDRIHTLDLEAISQRRCKTLDVNRPSACFCQTSSSPTRGSTMEWLLPDDLTG